MPARPRGLFVTGTDTGCGKTILSAALLATMHAAGERVHAHKPVVTGLAEASLRKAYLQEAPTPEEAPTLEEAPTPEEAPGRWPPDHQLLGLAAGMRPEDVAPLRFDAPVSPHLAARLAGERIEAEQVVRRARAAAERACAHERGVLIVEGVGGLLVPLTDGFSVCDLATELGLPLLIAARAGLGTINHTLLTLKAARGCGLEVRAVVLTPWPEQPTTMERSNSETIARLGNVEVLGLPQIEAPTPVKALNQAQFARAGKALPWRAWLAERSAG